MSDEMRPVHTVKAHTEKIFEVNVFSKFCFIIICEERKQKILIVNSSE